MTRKAVVVLLLPLPAPTLAGTAITLLCPPASKPRPGYNANRADDEQDVPHHRHKNMLVIQLESKNIVQVGLGSCKKNGLLLGNWWTGGST